MVDAGGGGVVAAPCNYTAVNASTNVSPQAWTLAARPDSTHDQCPRPGAFRASEPADVIRALYRALGCGTAWSPPSSFQAPPSVVNCNFTVNLLELFVYDNAYRTSFYSYGTRFPAFAPAAYSAPPEALHAWLYTWWTNTLGLQPFVAAPNMSAPNPGPDQRYQVRGGVVGAAEEVSLS